MVLGPKRIKGLGKSPGTRQSRRRALVRDLDDFARRIVMIRAGAKQVGRQNESGKLSLVWFGACQWCGVRRKLQWSHIHSRGAAPHMRWDPDNATAMCAHCHKFRWHDNPEGMREERERFLDRVLGSKRAVLAARAKQRGKTDAQLLLVWLKQELNKHADH